jgi:hypothetical protein
LLEFGEEILDEVTRFVKFFVVVAFVLAIGLGWNDGGFVGFFERADDNIETLLSNSSEMGRSGRIPGTRELAIPEDAIHRAVSSGWQRDSRFAHLHARAPWPETF